MKNHFFSWLSLSLLSVLGLQAQVYVTTSGNDGNPGTMASPKATIAAGVALATAGQTVHIASGTYTIAAMIVINKSITLLGNDGFPNTRPVLVMSATSVKTVLQVASKDVTIDNLNIQVLGSGGTSSAGNHGIFVANHTTSKSYDNLVIQNNLIENISGTNFGFTPINFHAYGIRLTQQSAFTQGDNYIKIINNRIFSQASGRAAFGRGIGSAGNYGDIENNTFVTNYAIQIADITGGNLRILSNAITLSTNDPGIEINTPQQNNGIHSIEGNTFTRVSSNPFAMIEIKNNGNLVGISSTINITDNTFTNINSFGIFCSRSSNINIENNQFSPLSSATTFNHIHINTKHRTTNSANTTPAVTVKNISIKNNTFNASGSVIGTGIQFANHFSGISPAFQNITIGGASLGEPNSFALNLGVFISLDAQIVGSNNVNPSIWGSSLTISTAAAVNNNFDARFNTYNVGAGQQLPTAMTGMQLMEVENKISHAIDQSGLGFITIKAKNVFVTPTSSLAGTASSGRIKRGTDVISTDGDTLNVQAFTYTQDGSAFPTTAFNTYFRAVGGIVASPNWQMSGVGKTLNLLTDLSISGQIIFSNGNIQTNANTLIFGSSATNPSADPAGNGEKNTSYIIGKAQTVRTIGGGTLDFFGLNLPAGADLGTLTLLRTSGPAGITTASPYSSIATKWSVNPSIANGRDNVEFRWLPAVNNGKDAGTLAAWRFGSGPLWEKATTDFVAASTSPLIISQPIDIAQFSDWTISDNPNPLPLNWLSLKAQMKPSGIAEIIWKTIEEKNTLHFIIERSIDGKSFEQIGKIQAANTFKTNEYRFEDLSLKTNLSQNVYYRIRQVDQNQDSTYSGMVRLMQNADNRQAFELYPNPNSGSFSIRFADGLADKSGIIKVYDAQSRLVLQKHYQSQSSDLQFDHVLPAGVYMLICQNNNGRQTSRMIVN